MLKDIDMEEIKLYEIDYSDLLKLVSEQKQASNQEIQRLESISKTIMQTLGRGGPGLLSITGVLEARMLSPNLLPLARKLARLDSDDRKRILKDHNLGSDVSLKNPNRTVSSFAMQMKYDPDFAYGEREIDDDELKNLGSTFRELGFCMMQLGLSLARLCDRFIGGCELQQSLLQCGTAKGRLIHYHSLADNAAAVKEAASRKRLAKAGRINTKEDDKFADDGNSNLWQQWHYDYGIFTILTSPMFLLSNGSNASECECPDGHTSLQVFHPEMNRVLLVKASKGSLIVQVGEAADILSKGKLRATLHSVLRPANKENVSRETFVVFLQPAWSKTISLSDYPVEYLASADRDSDSHKEQMHCFDKQSDGMTERIREIVPPLRLRLRDRMTFAEFSRETTKQYYGGHGLQPNK